MTQITIDNNCLFFNQKPILTPQKRPLCAPNPHIAQLLLNEWRAQINERGQLKPKPLTMPVTQFINSMIDQVTPHRPEKQAELCRYAMNDLVCHYPPQNHTANKLKTHWGSYLNHAKQFFNAQPNMAEGILETPPINPEYQRAVNDYANSQNEFQFALLYYATILTGSFLIAHRFILGQLTPARATNDSFMEQLVQEEYWGPDEESTNARKRILNELECLQLITGQLHNNH